MPHYRQGEASIAGKTAKDFALEMNGVPTRLSGLQGKVVVLNFWASWCPPCVAETPSLNALQERIQGRGGMVLGVNVDEDPEAYRKFLVQHGETFATLPDLSVQGSSAKGGMENGTSVYPETYRTGGDGKIALKIIG